MNRTQAGGLAWASVAQYFVVEELVRRAWTLPYSRSTNYISDLGARTCGTYEGRAVCSPDHAWMNLSFAAVGVAVAAGAVLLRAGAPELLSRAALAAYAAAGAGSVLVALVPEDAGSPLHGVGAGLYFVGASLGHVLLGARLHRRGARAYGVALVLVGSVGLVATALVAAGADLGLGAGFVERVVVYGVDAGFVATGLGLLGNRLRRARTGWQDLAR